MIWEIHKIFAQRINNIGHRCRVSLSIFYRIHFGECAKELLNLIPQSAFHNRYTIGGDIIFSKNQGIYEYKLREHKLKMPFLFEMNLLTFNAILKSFATKLSFPLRYRTAPPCSMSRHTYIPP